MVGFYCSWTNPRMRSCYNQTLLLWVTMNPGWGSIAVELTPQWGCVTTWIYMPWWGPIAVELTPSWVLLQPIFTFFIENDPMVEFYFSWTNPKLGSCYNPYLFLCVTMNPRWVSIAVELTPRWGPVTSRIYFSGWQLTQNGFLLQLNWPHDGLVLQPEFICHNGDLLRLN